MQPKKKLIYYIEELRNKNNKEEGKKKVDEIKELFPDDIFVDNFLSENPNNKKKTNNTNDIYYMLFYNYLLNRDVNKPLEKFIPKGEFLNLNNIQKVQESEDIDKILTYSQIGFTLLEAIKKSKRHCLEIIENLYEAGYSYAEVNFSISALYTIKPEWYFDEVDIRKLISEIEDLTEGKNIIDTLKLSNYFSIENIELTDLGRRKEIYFLGENGDGKTILLQSILLALKGNEGVESVFSYIKENDDFLQKHKRNELNLSAKSTNNRKYNFESDYKKQKTSFVNIYAYGVNRLRKSEDRTDGSGYASLFDGDAYLTSPVQWLKDVQLNYYSEKEKQEKGESVPIGVTPAQAKKLLEQVINFEEDKENLKVKIDGTNIRFIEKGTELQFEQLSDGYKSILILLSDLLSRLSTSQPYVTDATEYTGIVLIDELGVYLHPKWKYSITGLLRKLFPNIQWIFTTHSPIIVFGASKDAVFYKLYKEDAITRVSEPYSMETFSNKTINAFVTSSLFNLPSSKPAAYQKSEHDFETGNYVYDIIHTEVRKRLNEKPLQDNEIKDMVSKLLDKFEKEGKL